MNKVRFTRLWPLAVTIIFAFILLFAFGNQNSAPNTLYALSQPSFVIETNTPTDNAAIQAIQDEAGISAYFEASSSINLNSVRSAFQTIEIDEQTYILGTVAVAGYPEVYYPHVYVHSDGWFMAYYFDDDPAAKIIDWNAYTASGDTIISTILENTLTNVAGTAGVGVTDIYFYDFRYPNATTMMIITERDNGGGNDTFTINIPPSFGVAERSWSVNLSTGIFRLNGNTITSSSGFYNGTLAANQLPANTTHTFVVGNSDNDVGGIALIYTE